MGYLYSPAFTDGHRWVPAFAGMTKGGAFIFFTHTKASRRQQTRGFAVSSRPIVRDWRGALKDRKPIFWGSLPAPRARYFYEIRPASLSVFSCPIGYRLLEDGQKPYSLRRGGRNTPGSGTARPGRMSSLHSDCLSVLRPSRSSRPQADSAAKTVLKQAIAGRTNKESFAGTALFSSDQDGLEPRPLYWRRDAAQFKGGARGEDKFFDHPFHSSCPDLFRVSMPLPLSSERGLWNGPPE